MSQKKHYFMATGEIVFSVKDKPEINVLRLNALVEGNTSQIPVRVLGKAQQSLQLQFHQRMDDPQVEIRDLVIINMTYLGHMTDEEFRKPPEGMKEQEAQDEKVDLLDPSLDAANNPFH